MCSSDLMLFGSLTFVAILFGRPVRTSFTPCVPDFLMAKDFKALVLYVSELFIALPWIPKNSP